MVDESSLDSFQRDGAICIRQLFTPVEIALLRGGIDANMAGLSPRAIVASGAQDPGRFVAWRCE